MNKRSTKSDLTKLDRIKDEEIDYSDIPALGEEFFSKALAAWPPLKQQLTIRLDRDVIEWLKASGRGYQTRINHILRAAMEGIKPPVSQRGNGAVRIAKKEPVGKRL